MAKDTNLAYAIRTFEQEEVQRQPHIRKVEKTSAATKPKGLVKTGLCMFYVLALCVSLIYGRVMLTEANADLQAKEAEYKVLDSEYTRLSTELNSIVSLSNIEEKAAELGMGELTPSQIEYIKLAREDKVELAQEENDLLSKVSRWFNDVKEYIFG